MLLSELPISISSKRRRRRRIGSKRRRIVAVSFPGEGRCGLSTRSGRKMTGDNGISDRSPLVSPHVEDEYSEIFRNFTKGLKVPAVPFLEFSTDFGGGIAEISDDSYSDIFGGFGWDVAVSLEELLGGLMVGAGKKDAEKKARQVWGCFLTFLLIFGGCELCYFLLQFALFWYLTVSDIFIML